MAYAFPPQNPEVDRIIYALEKASPTERIRYLRSQGGHRRFLYKYRALDPADPCSVNRLRDVVVHSRLWLSCVEDFNDPFDMSAKIEVRGSKQQKHKRVQEVLKTAGYRYKDRRKLTPSLVARADELIAEQAQIGHANAIKTAGVYSFAGHPLNILMWSHYAANHTGICLQFDVHADLRCFLTALRVHYDDRYPVLNWIDDIKSQLFASLLRKHSGWKYEEESRLVWPDCARHHVRFEPAALRSIFIGCRANTDVEDVIVHLLQERKAAGRPSVTVYRVRKHQSRYKLHITY